MIIILKIEIFLARTIHIIKGTKHNKIINKVIFAEG